MWQGCQWNITHSRQWNNSRESFISTTTDGEGSVTGLNIWGILSLCFTTAVNRSKKYIKKKKIKGHNSSAGGASDKKMPATILTQVWFTGATRDFLPSQLSVQIHWWCLHSPHASASVCMLKSPNRDSHTTVWTRENTARTGTNG